MKQRENQKISICVAA